MALCVMMMTTQRDDAATHIRMPFSAGIISIAQMRIARPRAGCASEGVYVGMV